MQKNRKKKWERWGSVEKPLHVASPRRSFSICTSHVQMYDAYYFRNFTKILSGEDCSVREACHWRMACKAWRRMILCYRGRFPRLPPRRLQYQVRNVIYVFIMYALASSFEEIAPCDVCKRKFFELCRIL